MSQSYCQKTLLELFCTGSRSRPISKSPVVSEGPSSSGSSNGSTSRGRAAPGGGSSKSPCSSPGSSPNDESLVEEVEPEQSYSPEPSQSLSEAGELSNQFHDASGTATSFTAISSSSTTPSTATRVSVLY